MAITRTLFTLLLAATLLAAFPATAAAQTDFHIFIGTATFAFVIASFFAGIAGGLYAHYVGAVNPTRFSVDQMVYVLVWAVVGGTATFHGPILGVVVLTVINEIVLRALGLDTARPLIYGAILILSVLYLPNGLESLGPRLQALWRRRRGGPAAAGREPA